MWDVKGPLIQVEVGNKVLQSYIDKDKKSTRNTFWGGNKLKEGDRFLIKIEGLRNTLGQKGIYLPYISFRNADIPANQFCIYFGMITYIGNIEKENLMEVLSKFAQLFQIEEPSPQKVSEIFGEGVELLEQKRYTEAVDKFLLSYYWADLYNCPEEQINSAINLGGISLVNNRIDDAILGAQKACFLAEDSSFSNPYLKFHAHNLLANLNWLAGDCEQAMENYWKSAVDIQYVKEAPLYVSALWNTANACLLSKQYSACDKLLDKIFQIVSIHDEYPKYTMVMLHQYQIYIKECISLNQQIYIDELLKRNEELSKSFLVRLKEESFRIIRQHGGILMATFLGSLSNAQVMINNKSFNGNKEINQY